jgi:hypothetical protein
MSNTDLAKRGHGATQLLPNTGFRRTNPEPISEEAVNAGNLSPPLGFSNLPGFSVSNVGKIQK